MRKAKSGFTIVELVIVIVVIGILAAITIVSYTGIQSRAKESSLQSSISHIRKVMAIYRSNNGDYPSCPTVGVIGPTYNGGAECQFNPNVLPLLQSVTSGLSLNDANMYIHFGNQWGIFVVRSWNGQACKFGEDVDPNWWGSSPLC